MKKALILLLFFIVLFDLIVLPVAAQEASSEPQPQPEHEQQQQEDSDYQKWLEENKRIEEENKKIDEKNKEIDEKNRQDQERYQKQLDEYNKAKQAREDALKNRPVYSPPPRVYKPQPVVNKPTPTPVPEASPNLTLLIQGRNDAVDEKTKKSEAETIEKINAALKAQNIIVKKDAADLITLTTKNITLEIRFPMIVNLETKTIQVITSTGVKSLSVLPVQVLEKLKNEQKVFDITFPLRLEEVNKQLIYTVKAKKTFKVLRLFSITRPLEYHISAENGDVVNVSKNFITSLIQKLSF